MAIDTESKRRSTIYILPVPDGAISQADRQQVAYIYSGISGATVTGLSLGTLYNVPAEDRVYLTADEAENIYNVPAEDRVYEVPE